VVVIILQVTLKYTGFILISHHKIIIINKIHVLYIYMANMKTANSMETCLAYINLKKHGDLYKILKSIFFQIMVFFFLQYYMYIKFNAFF